MDLRRSSSYAKRLNPRRVFGKNMGKSGVGSGGCVYRLFRLAQRCSLAHQTAGGDAASSPFITSTGVYFVRSLNFAISPDGRRLAFVAAAQDGGTALWIRSLAAGAAQQLTGTEGAAYPFWSPDSRQVGFFQASKLKSIDPSSGAVQILCDAPSGYGGAWDDRGTILFAGYNRSGGSISTLLKVSASGGEPELATRTTRGIPRTFWPSALPDGDHFLYFLLGSSESLRNRESMSGLSVRRKTN